MIKDNLKIPKHFNILGQRINVISNHKFDNLGIAESKSLENAIYITEPNESVVEDILPKIFFGELIYTILYNGQWIKYAKDKKIIALLANGLYELLTSANYADEYKYYSNNPDIFLIPETFTLYGQQIMVVFDDDIVKESSNVGECFYYLNVINIQNSKKEGYSKSQADATFLHEFIHMIFMGGDYTKENANEPLIEFLAQSLYQYFLTAEY